MRSHPAQSGDGHHQAVPRRSHPAKTGEDRFGPPTLERSGFEHRVGRFTSFLLRRKAWLEVELSLQERRRGRKNSPSVFR